MAAALRGNLRDFGIAEVFQLIGQQRKTGTLEVQRDRAPALVRFDRGGVVDAEQRGAFAGAGLGEMLVRVGLLTPGRHAEAATALAGTEDELHDWLLREGELQATQLQAVTDLVTQEILFDLLQLSEGSFEFVPGPVAPRRDGGDLLPAEQILMDGLRMVDEWNAFDADAADPSTVFRAVGSFDELRDGIAGEPHRAAAERLFLRIDGRIPGQRVVDLSRLGRFEGVRLLSLMRLGGLIEPVVRDPKARAVASAPVSGRSTLGVVLAGAPFALLAALVAWIVATGPAPAPASLGPSPTRRAALAAEALRIRNAVEAHYFATGRWPATLDEVARSDAPDLGLQSLAAADPASYYYRPDRAGFVLLPPSH